jgi:hypothetical protein
VWAALCGLVVGPAYSQDRTAVAVEAAQPLGPVGHLYNVGYNGWGDITNAGMVAAFQELGIQYCRMDLNLRELCGERPGDYRWDYATPADVGIGFTDRVRKILTHGWTPLLAFSYHASVPTLPKWFHGENHDGNQKAWTRYNVDGSLATEGLGDQLGQATRIAQDTAAHLANLGLRGLAWETMWEMGHDMPLVEIHHAVAQGVREADPTARIVGPATWPGWTVEERFVKPYLAQYGPDLLDAVSMHWYAALDHDLWKLWAGEADDWILTMAHEKYLAFMMSKTGSYGDWTRSLHALLQDPGLNPTGKKIGIIFTEIDVNQTSYYLRNPVNPDWPRYRADTDCWLNTNYYGGVWWASVLCHLASAGCAADAAKFNTRNYYGIQELAPPDKAYRYPVWFAFQLLREQGGLQAGRPMVAAAATGGGAPLVEAFATGGPDDLRVIVINKSFSRQAADIHISGLAPGDWKATRYRFDQSRVAQNLGRKPGEQADGVFEGAPEDDSKSAQCLEPLGTLECHEAQGAQRIADLECPPISFTVLRFRRG